MKTCASLPLLAALFTAASLPGRGGDAKAGAAFPHFRTQEIETKLGVGYAVLLVDLNGDAKKDVVVVDQRHVFWYENPGWKRRLILEGETLPDNVCIAAHDIDGDGQLDLALGSGWKGLTSKADGELGWLKRDKNPDDPWKLYPIAGEPSVHRIRFADVDGDGKPELINVPRLGRDSSKEKNWMDGSPVRIIAYKIPQDPTRNRWPPTVLDESLHVIHNFHPVESAGGKGVDILTASYEGVHLLTRQDDKWARRQLGEGNQSNLKGNRGASEIKQGRLKSGRKVIATIEPWHGNQVVVYTEPDDAKKLWDRHVIDEQLRWGHAVWFADLDGDGGDELIIGVRDNLSKKPGEQCGVRLYKALDDKGAKWARHFVDEGGVAVEDLAAADLDGDGRIDLVAVGRATKNARIYWNQGMK